jgi:hypothetical protein
LSFVLFKTRRFGDWILSPSSSVTYSDEPNRKRRLRTTALSVGTGQWIMSKVVIVSSCIYLSRSANVVQLSMSECQ